MGSKPPAKPTDETNASRFGLYLTDVGAYQTAGLSLFQMQDLFLIAVRDFRAGRVSLEELSWICNELWNHTTVSHEKDSDLGKAIHAGSQLSLLVREINNLPSAELFARRITSVMEFYHRTRHRKA